jgi:rRNA maturation endonuclease Nob1
MEDFFRLGLIPFTTPQVIAEITDDEQLKEITFYIDNGQLNIDDIGEYETIIEIADQHAALSITDSSVLELAIRKDAILLTSDGSLRKISISENVKVRGLLWIIEELYIKQIITVELALQKLQMYNEINVRAPFKEIENLIKKLKQL